MQLREDQKISQYCHAETVYSEIKWLSMWLVKHINWKFWRKKWLSTSSVIKILFNPTLFMQNPNNISLPEMTNISLPNIFSPNHFHPSHTAPAQGHLINFFKGATLLSPYIPSPEWWVIRPRWTGWSAMLIRVCPRNLQRDQTFLVSLCQACELYSQVEGKLDQVRGKTAEPQRWSRSRETEEEIS